MSTCVRGLACQTPTIGTLFDCKSLRQRLRDIGQSPTAASRALAALILEPIAPHLTDADHLLISPDRQLNRIPFEALRDTEGNYSAGHFA